MNAPCSRPAGSPGWSGRHLLCILLLILLTGCGADAATSPAVQPLAVAVETATPSRFRQHETFTGRIRGVREVDVKAQVAGVLQERLHDEGAFVEQGQPLFRIDPEPYQLEVDKARARLDHARAELEQTERDWHRHSNLYQKHNISEQTLDQTTTRLELAENNAARARAALQDAERLLRYTRVEAPVSGVVGMETISEGNLIEAGSTLSTITQLDQVHVHFAVPAAIASAELLQAAQSGETVELLLNGADYQWPGSIDYVDSRIDRHTDSISMRATFPNPDRQLLAGHFVRIRVPMRTLEGAFLIDATSVSEGPTGPRVFLAEGDVARAQPVKLGPVVGGRQVIVEGLSSGQQIIVNGHANLSNGRTIAAADTPEGQR